MKKAIFVMIGIAVLVFAFISVFTYVPETTDLPKIYRNLEYKYLEHETLDEKTIFRFDGYASMFDNKVPKINELIKNNNYNFQSYVEVVRYNGVGKPTGFGDHILYKIETLDGETIWEIN